MSINTRYLKDLSEAEWQELENLYKNGTPVKELAIKFNKPANNLGNALKKRCPYVERSHNSRLIRTLTEQEWLEIGEFYKKGISIKDISEKFNLCADTLAKPLQERFGKIDSKLYKKYSTPYGELQFNNKEDWQPLYNDYINGKSLRELAKYTSLNYKTIIRVFSYHGFNRVSLEEEKRRCIENTKKTILNKYGVEAPLQNKDILQKSKNTIKEKYGVENVGQLDSIKEKIRETCLNKYGVEWTTQLPQMKDKSKKTCLEKYGTEYYTQTEEYRDKYEQTCLEKYGVKHHTQSDICKEKAKETCIQKYGVDHHTKTEEYKERIHNKQIKEHEAEVLSRLKGTGLILLDKYDGIYSKITKSYKYYNIKCTECGHVFKMQLAQVPVCPKCHPHASSFELELKEYIKSIYRGTIEEHVRFDNREIDIYLPELKIGFEVNGTYWHSCVKRSKNYHKHKTDLMLKHGISIVHVWDYYNKEAIFHRVKSILGVNEKIYARNTVVKEVSKEEAIDFFNNNHLDKYTPAIFTLGLYKENTLLSALSFRKHKEGIEIARFATKDNVTVVAGFSKLLKHSIQLIKERYTDIHKIVTYCDRDWTANYINSVYYKNGFTFVGDSGPILKYYDLRKCKIIARQQLQKHKLKDKYSEYYDDSLTANEILAKVKIIPLYNSGNFRFEKEI